MPIIHRIEIYGRSEIVDIRPRKGYRVQQVGPAMKSGQPVPLASGGFPRLRDPSVVVSCDLANQQMTVRSETDNNTCVGLWRNELWELLPRL